MLTKHSFAPVINESAVILILGSMPGDRSIELNQYYGHQRNRFWKIIAKLAKVDLPEPYSEKIELLYQAQIGLWDVIQSAERKGSLDSDIKLEKPNPIDELLMQYPRLKTIAFNGKKAEAVYDKHFDRIPEINYISLPSTSPANASFNFDRLFEKWSELSS